MAHFAVDGLATFWLKPLLLSTLCVLILLSLNKNRNNDNALNRVQMSRDALLNCLRWYLKGVTKIPHFVWILLLIGCTGYQSLKFNQPERQSGSHQTPATQ